MYVVTAQYLLWLLRLFCLLLSSVCQQRVYSSLGTPFVWLEDTSSCPPAIPVQGLQRNSIIQSQLQFHPEIILKISSGKKLFGSAGPGSGSVQSLTLWDK